MKERKEKEKKNMFFCKGTDKCIRDIMGRLACDVCDEWGKCGNCSRKDAGICEKCGNRKTDV